LPEVRFYAERIEHYRDPVGARWQSGKVHYGHPGRCSRCTVWIVSVSSLHARQLLAKPWIDASAGLSATKRLRTNHPNACTVPFSTSPT